MPGHEGHQHKPEFYFDKFAAENPDVHARVRSDGRVCESGGPRDLPEADKRDCARSSSGIANHESQGQHQKRSDSAGG